MHPFDIEDKKSAIRKELTKLAEQLGKSPTIKDYKRLNKSSIGLEQMTYLYGKWSTALVDAGLQPNPDHQPPRALEIPKEALIDNFVRVCNQLKAVPGMHQFRAVSNYSWVPYKTRWGSWTAAKDSILQECPERFEFDVSASIYRNIDREERKVLGLGCPIVYQPTNEYETIALFCILAAEMGFRIKAIKASFPDGLLEKDGHEVLAEFEYLSSNYLQHGHPLDAKCVCICWRRDADIPGIDILSLEEYLRSQSGGSRER